MRPSRQQALEILRLPSSASREEIEKQFRARVSDVHPDHGGNPDDLADVIAARDRLLDETGQEMVTRAENSLSTKELSSDLVALERERDLQRQRREKSEGVTRGLVRVEVNRLARFRRTAHFLAWLGGGAGAATLALSATTFRGAGSIENLWIAQVALICIVVSLICAVAGFVISGQIARMEQALEDAAEAMSDRSTFLDLFYEISEYLEEANAAAWTTSELKDAVQSWSIQNASYEFWKPRRKKYVKGPKKLFYAPQELRRRFLSVFGQLEANPTIADLAWVIGPAGFSRLLLAKGEETGLLTHKERLEDGRLQVQHRLALEGATPSS
jgi:transposase-like protein